MSNITLDIAGRRFTVACGPGEEPHIEMLGRIIDSKLEGMPGLASQAEARCLLYAALLLADEVHELRTGASPAEDGRAAEALERVAESLEGLAARLEN